MLTVKFNLKRNYEEGDLLQNIIAKSIVYRLLTVAVLSIHYFLGNVLDN